MNGRHILLMLAHLFRKCGKEVETENAIHILSFKWRYGKPSAIRKILTIAVNNEMIKVEGEMIIAEFLYDSQVLHPNQAEIISRQSTI